MWDDLVIFDQTYLPPPDFRSKARFPPFSQCLALEKVSFTGIKEASPLVCTAAKPAPLRVQHGASRRIDLFYIKTNVVSRVNKP